MYKDITFGRRVLVILVDYLIVGLVLYLFAILSANFFFKGLVMPEELVDWTNNMGSIEELNALIEGNPEIRAYINISMQFVGVIFLEIFIIDLVYFVLIPLFWSKQTLGRFIFKVKLVKENYQDIRTGTLLMREIVGNVFLILLTCLCGIIPIVNLVLMISKNRSIADLVSQTKLVDLKSPIEKRENVITVDPREV